MVKEAGCLRSTGDITQWRRLFSEGGLVFSKSASTENHLAGRHEHGSDNQGRLPAPAGGLAESLGRGVVRGWVVAAGPEGECAGAWPTWPVVVCE